MKCLGLSLLLTMCLIGCSGGDKTEAPVSDAQPMSDKEMKENRKADESAAPSTAKKKFEDDVFKVPVYPGAKEAEYTRLIMDSDVVKSYNCTFQTSDDPDKVADFYNAEGAKVGKIIDLPLGAKPGTGLRVVAVQVNEKEKIQIQATKNPKDGTTAFTLHYIISKR